MAFNEWKAYENFWASRGVKVERLPDVLDDQFWKREHLRRMECGKRYGWWDEYDDVGPIRLWYVDVQKFPTWAHLLAANGFFPSISQARKAGHDKPLTVGEFRLFKGREKFIVE